jgi:peptidoglycan/xylan/chitin deacetylase (PgdA/CDA1 family)
MGAFKNFFVASSIAGLALARPQHNEKRAANSIINSCTVPGVVALTFDDGPYLYTQDIVNQLNAAGLHATFFQNGESSV